MAGGEESEFTVAVVIGVGDASHILYCDAFVKGTLTPALSQGERE